MFVITLPMTPDLTQTILELIHTFFRGYSIYPRTATG